ncbi:MAG: hypothetical protein ACWA47_10135 [Brevirhabdus sp.]
MSLASVAIILAGAGVVVTGLLALAFLRDPAKGLEQTTHHLEDLPKVMADRYLFMTFLALGAVIHGDMAVIAWLFAGFAFMGYADALIYARAGKSYSKHFVAGVAASVVMIVAVLALRKNGAV